MHKRRCLVANAPPCHCVTSPLACEGGRKEAPGAILACFFRFFMLQYAW